MVHLHRLLCPSCMPLEREPLLVSFFRKRRTKVLGRYAVDLQSGQMVWVGKNRKACSLEPFLRRLRRVSAPIEAIAMDMWSAYITAVLKYYSHTLPCATGRAFNFKE